MDSNNQKISTKDFVLSIIKYNISYLIVSVINIALIPVLTRVFSTEEYGTLNLFIAASTFMSSLFSFGMINGYTRFFNEPPEGTNEKTLRVKCVAIPVLTTLIVALLLWVVAPEEFLSRTIGVTDISVFPILFVYVILTYIFLFIPVYYRMKMDVKKYTIVQIASSFLTKASVLLVLLVPVTVVSITFFQTFGLLILAVIIAILSYRQWKDYLLIAFSKSAPTIRKVYKFSLLSWPTTIMASANQFLTQNAICNVLDKDSLGIYSALSIFSGIIIAVKGGFSTYWSSFIYKYYKNEQEKIQSVHDIIMFMLCILVVLTMCFRDVIFLLVGNEFRGGMSICILVMSYSIFMFASESTLYGIYLSNKPQIVSVVSALSMVVNLVGIYVLVPELGLFGVGISACISGVLHFVINSYYGQKYYKMVKNPFRTFMAVLLIVIVAFANYYITDLWGVILVSIIVIGIACVLYRSLIKKSIEIFKKYAERR